MNEFFKKKDEDFITAKKTKINYNKEYGDPENVCIEQDIVSDTESVEWGYIDLTGETEWKKEIEMNEKSSLNDILLRIFPLVSLGMPN